ncbi:two-component sensor histidine kinase [Sphaerisporangium melleum]|uniref:histidine kinase n=1 Tax=Sphaerisporangium melleum TaxID=321316 RepID=A0A917RG99_9ACTN|nr:two-component sensor histidine kinase [Sphaerisporangium melleum]GII74224.1 two-component sensor histidine kinase [Sphaerisporangium melleum]
MLAAAGAVAVVWGDLTPATPGWYLWADIVGGALACAGIWLCRRWPVAASLAVIALSVPAAAASVAAGIATLIAALYRRPPVAAAVGVAWVAATLVRFAWRPPGLAPYPVWALVGVLFGGAIVGWGIVARTRRELLASLAERARRAEADQRVRAEEARRAERLDIAREMHDVLAHRLSLLAVHAGALHFNAAARPDEVAEAAGVIRTSAHQALQELRAVISVLRESPSAELPLTGLAPLVKESRRAGMRIELHEHGVRFAGLPETTRRTAYRVVQEGLTNARKHAPGRPVTVTVSGAAGGELTVEVRNPLPAGREAAELATTGAGAGLAGLEERVSLAGGHLERGPTNDGGFRLAARLPWPHE